MPRGQPRPLSQLAQRTHPMATISAVPMTTPSAPKAMALAMSMAVRMPPLADQGHVLPDAFLLQEAVHLRDGVLDGLGDVLLGDLRGRAGASVPAVQVDDVARRRSSCRRPPSPRRSGVETFTESNAFGFTAWIQSRCFLWSSTE